jgi:putative isomerase
MLSKHSFLQSTKTLHQDDNFITSLLTELDNRDIQLFSEVVKSKTTAGFIPNWSTGGLMSQDRTEPPVGGRVLLELYQKYKDRWLVEPVFDDLMDWNNWFMDNRLLAPFDVIALGSFYNNSYDDTHSIQHHVGGTNGVRA